MRRLIFTGLAFIFAASLAFGQTDRGSTTGQGARARVPETLKHLKKKISQVSFEEASLDQVMDYIGGLSPMQVVVRWQVLEDAGIERDKPVTMNVQDLRLSQVLWMVLKEAGGTDLPLAYRASGRILTISTAEDLGKEMVVRVYDVSDLLVRAQRFRGAPHLDLAQAGQGGGGSGGGSQNIFGGGGGSQTDDQETGQGGRGFVARGAMLVTGLLHLGLAGVAFTLLFTGDDGGSSGGSTLTKTVDAIMGLPAGRWMVGLVGLTVIAYGGYYIVKAWRGTYRDRLVANHFTEYWNPALKAGLMAKGIVIAIVGGLAIFAAWTADPQQAGGTGEALGWLTGQPYGRILVGLICVGLLGFALYCFVSAAYRFVPKASFGSERTLGESLEARARAAAR